MFAKVSPPLRREAYTLEQFTKVIREGLTPDGRQINPMYMPWKSFAHMNDVEMKALWAYLQSVQPKAFGGR